MKRALSTYSYWHFREPKVAVETVIDQGRRTSAERRSHAPLHIELACQMGIPCIQLNSGFPNYSCL